MNFKQELPDSSDFQGWGIAGSPSANRAKETRGKARCAENCIATVDNSNAIWIIYRLSCGIHTHPGPSGGIGRRSGFKILCPNGRAGSSPASGTSFQNVTTADHTVEFDGAPRNKKSVQDSRYLLLRRNGAFT